MDFRRKFCRRDAELGREIVHGTAAEAIAAARKSLVVLMLMVRRGISAVVGVLFGARFGVRGIQMKRSMGIAARERERQQDHQAAQEQGSLHGMSTQLEKFRNLLNPA
jgi:hypothetical protein